MNKKQQDKSDISTLLDIMARLRDPAGGCPWDLAQDFASIAPYTIEEAYEVADAIERRAFDELPDELGDLLFQVVFHAQMGKDEGRFEFADVVRSICDKMIRRHPHVFDRDPAAERSAEKAGVEASWEAIKQSEQPERASLLDGIALALPALVRAAKLGRRAASVGFDWPSVDGARAKVDEEVAELDEALEAGDAERIEAEIGDLLFSVVNLSRHAGVDAERALRRSNERFASRFRHVEAAVADGRGAFERYDAEELDTLWNEAKRAG